MLIKNKKLLKAIASAVVEELHSYEARLSTIVVKKRNQTLSPAEAKQMALLSASRVAASSVIFAFGSLDVALIEEQCEALGWLIV